MHNIGEFSSILKEILHSGNFLLCMMVTAALFCGKKFVFGIPLPSTLLTFGFLTALCYGHPAPPGAYLLKGTEAVWPILLIALLFFRQYELFFAAATTMIITLTLVAVNWINFLWIREIAHHELKEYLIAFGYFWYSLELFLGQMPSGGEIVRWKSWLAERVAPSLSHFSPACSMTDFCRSPLVITCFFVASTTLGLLYLGYSAADLQSERTAVHNVRKAIEGREPVIRSYFDVYITKDEIVYHKNPCSRPALNYLFFLDVTPVPHAKSFPSRLFFDFWEKGGIVAKRLREDQTLREMCLMSVPVPKYEIAHIRTGQWLRWEGTWPSSVNDYETIYSAIVSEHPLVRSDFDIYIDDNVLIYTKESCTPSDTEANFFLHVHPSDKRHLPSRRSQYGFDNRDFLFSEHGKLFDDKCIAVVRLPRYDISRIVSGQYTSEGRLWEVGFPLSVEEEQRRYDP